MSLEKLIDHGRFTLLEIESENKYDWDETCADRIRVSLAPSHANQMAMAESGYVFADRTIDVSINLARTSLDFGSLIRTEPTMIDDRRDEIAAIAEECFTTDSRFHLRPNTQDDDSGIVIRHWVDALSDYRVIVIKGDIAGFLATVDDDPSSFIQLAAVSPRYRLGGVALSLYASAARDCLAAGKRSLRGRISSTNTAVMNIYALLGATFSNPLDVFLK